LTVNVTKAIFEATWAVKQLALAKTQTTIIKFSLSKSLKRFLVIKILDLSFFLVNTEERKARKSKSFVWIKSNNALYRRKKSNEE
jgi:hypothetical protein